MSITLQNGTTLYEMYDGFSVSNEAGKYQLLLEGPATGTLGDEMTYHDLMNFSTPDRDNDLWSGHCAAAHDLRGGWWFNHCNRVYFNGRWSPELWNRPWTPTVKTGASVRGTTMMIRRN
ncbi:ficolin-2-like [Saccostrea cucullata]|uniref:ficolin-2-like n=1 Tax=Saccostrea cuccullata TaxID=36930 RepID=UPI002ECFF54D